MQPIITIFCAFSRPWAIDRWLSDLEKVEHDPSLTNLCFIVDMDYRPVLDKLNFFAKRHRYRNFYYIMNSEWEPNEVRLAVRRQRIADMKNQSKELIAKCDGDIIIGLEDDTVFGDMDIHRLIDPIINDKTVGFVEGVQCGRWGVNMIGAWQADHPNEPETIETLLPPEDQTDPYQKISAGGFYGYATTRELYLAHGYYSRIDQPYGPDVNFGLFVSSKGLTCLIDWQTVFGHNDHDRILYPATNGKIEKVTFSRESSNVKWNRSDT